MKENTLGIYRPNPLYYIAFYAVWLALAVGSLFLIWEIRNNLISWVTLLAPHQFTWNLIKNATLAIMGIVILVTMIVSEHTLRMGLMKQRFMARLAQIVIILAVALGLSYLIKYGMQAIIPFI